MPTTDTIDTRESRSRFVRAFGAPALIAVAQSVARLLYASAFAAPPLRAMSCVSRITVRAASVSSP